VTSQLTRLDADEYRARLTQRVTTGTRPGEESVVAEVHSYFPLRRRPKRENSPSKDRRPPEGLETVGTFRSPKGSGFRYACLSGDLNPIHWLGPAARAAGFKGPILHGFATMALAQTCLERETAQHVQCFDLRFTRPFLIPGEARVLLNQEGQVQVIDQDENLLMAGDVRLKPRLSDPSAPADEGQSKEGPEP